MCQQEHPGRAGRICRLAGLHRHISIRSLRHYATVLAEPIEARSTMGCNDVSAGESFSEFPATSQRERKRERHGARAAALPVFIVDTQERV